MNYFIKFRGIPLLVIPLKFELNQKLFHHMLLGADFLEERINLLYYNSSMKVRTFNNKKITKYKNSGNCEIKKYPLSYW